MIIPAQAYGYSGAFDAYLALNSTLHRVVEDGEFTALVNVMSRGPKFSRAYRAPVYSNSIIVDPFLFSQAPTTLSPTKFSSVVSDAAPSSLPPVRQNAVIYIVIAIAVCVCCASLAFHVDWMYFSAERRKQRKEAEKKREYREGVIPESDTILWLGSEPFETVGNARIHGYYKDRYSVSSSHSYDDSTDVSLVQSNRSVEEAKSSFDEQPSLTTLSPNNALHDDEEDELIFG